MKIELDHDGRTKRCIIIDGKSYVLENYDGSLTIKGATLRSRSNEQFTIRFINDCIDHLLNEQPEQMKDEYEKWKSMIEAQLMPIDLIKKRQSLNESLETYRNKLEAGQSKRALYEAAIQSERNILKGDIVETWVEEPEPVLKKYKTTEDKWVIPNKKVYEQVNLAKNFDGNIYRKHYQKRLDDTARKLVVVTGKDNFEKWFEGVSLRKRDKFKLVSVMGLKEFAQEFGSFGWTQSYYDDLSQEDQELFHKIGLTLPE